MISIPFRGSKQYSYKHEVRPIAIAGGYDTVLEPFGGSAVLSVNLKYEGIVGTAVINDYDRLWDIYPDYLDVKDELVKRCKKRGLKKCTKLHNKNVIIEPDGSRTPVPTCLLSEEHKAILREEVSKIDEKYWPLLATGSCLTWDGVTSEDRIRLKHFKYFKNGLETEKPREYLKAVYECEVLSLDWRDFLEATKDRFGPGTLIILDPPYTGATPGVYRSDRPYTESDTREVVAAAVGTGCDFILFNYDADEISSALAEFGITPERIGPTGSNTKTASRRAQDIMAYVRRER